MDKVNQWNFFFWTGSHAAQAGLKLSVYHGMTFEFQIFLLLPPKFWDDRYGGLNMLGTVRRCGPVEGSVAR